MSQWGFKILVQSGIADKCAGEAYTATTFDRILILLHWNLEEQQTDKVPCDELKTALESSFKENRHKRKDGRTEWQSHFLSYSLQLIRCFRKLM